MQKFIKIGNGEYIPVVEIYAYTYDGGLGKLVLRIVVDPSVQTFDELSKLLKDNTLPIQEYWGEVKEGSESMDYTLKAEYTGFIKDYKCSYNSEIDYPDKFYIEITRKTEAELQADINQKLISANDEAIVSLFEMAI